MRLSLLIITSVAFGLIGCAELKRQEAEKAFVEGKAQCVRQFPIPPGKYTERISCVTDAYNAHLRAYDRNSDLADLQGAYESSVAVKVDRGEITREQARLETARFNSQIATQREARELARQQANTNQLSAAAAFQQANRPMPLVPIQPYMMQTQRTPLQTNCTRFENNINCTSY